MFDPRERLSVTQDGDRLYAKARQDGIETVWARHEAQQPQCGFCDMGLSCRICIMGPCRVDPFGEGPQTGVCGADADIIVARNLCRMVAAGAASHSDHGRDLVEVLAGIVRAALPAALRMIELCSLSTRRCPCSRSTTKLRLRSLADCDIRCMRSSSKTARAGASRGRIVRIFRPTRLTAEQSPMTRTRQMSSRATT